MVLLLLVDYALMLRSKHIHFVAARAFGLACILFALAGSRGLAAARDGSSRGGTTGSTCIRDQRTACLLHLLFLSSDEQPIPFAVRLDESIFFSEFSSFLLFLYLWKLSTRLRCRYLSKRAQIFVLPAPPCLSNHPLKSFIWFEHLSQLPKASLHK